MDGTKSHYFASPNSEDELPTSHILKPLDAEPRGHLSVQVPELPPDTPQTEVSCTLEEPSQNTASSSADIYKYKQFLSRHAPTKLLAPATQKQIWRYATERLGRAKNNSVHIDDLYIGKDCLPDWPSRVWDDTEETFRNALSRELAGLWASSHLGGILSIELCTKGNRRLDEARSLGLPLEKIRIGDDILPTWLEDSEDLDILHAPRSTRNAVNKITDGSELPTGCHPPNSVESESSDNEDTDRVSLLDFVDDQSLQADGDEHILHDAQVVGAPNGSSWDVDLEVFVANDDDDIDYLPEIEFGIDQVEFEEFFDVEEVVVDVETVGVEILFSAGGIMGEDPPEVPKGNMRNRASRVPQEDSEVMNEWIYGDDKSTSSEDISENVSEEE